jgi:hypothetical protein
MRVVKEDESYRALHITGPTTNLLRLRFGAGPLEVVGLGGGDAPARVDAEDVRREVEDAVTAFNQAEGTGHQLCRIEFVVTDTPQDGIYARLAQAILRKATAEG